MWRLEDRIEGSEHLANRDGSEQRQEGVPVGVNDSSERENQGTEAHIGQVTVIAFSAFPFCVHISIWEACWVYPSAGERVEKGVQALSRFAVARHAHPPTRAPAPTLYPSSVASPPPFAFFPNPLHSFFSPSSAPALILSSLRCCTPLPSTPVPFVDQPQPASTATTTTAETATETRSRPK